MTKVLLLSMDRLVPIPMFWLAIDLLTNWMTG